MAPNLADAEAAARALAGSSVRLDAGDVQEVATRALEILASEPQQTLAGAVRAAWLEQVGP